jgi:NitT/TauT family transport system substrate-binding protein
MAVNGSGTDVSRRTFLRTGALAASAIPLGMALSACGPGSSGSTTTTGSTPATTSAPATTPATSSTPLAGAPTTPATVTPFTFNLGFNPNGRNAPFYYANKLGLYKDAGVDVTIQPSSGTGVALQLLSAGQADTAIVSGSALLKLMGTTPSPAMKSYATIYTKSLSSIFFIKGKGIQTPKDLEGKTIATSTGSNEFLLFPIFAAANGIDANKITWKTVDAAVKTGLVLTGEVDATSTTAFGMAQLQAKAAAGQEIGVFTYGDYGVDGDVTILSATSDFAETKSPDAMRAFIEASMEGFKQTIANPQGAVDAMKQAVDTLDPAIALAELDILAEVYAGPAQQANGLGYNNPEQFSALIDLVNTYFDVTLSGTPDTFFSNAYIGKVMP